MNTNEYIENDDLSEIIRIINLNVHQQCVQIRKENDIKKGRIIMFADYAMYPTEDRKYYTFHYVVHVDKESEKWFIIYMQPANEDEYLESLI